MKYRGGNFCFVFFAFVVAFLAACEPPPPTLPKTRSLSEIDAEIKRVNDNAEMRPQEKSGTLYGLSREREFAVRASAVKP